MPPCPNCGERWNVVVEELVEHAEDEQIPCNDSLEMEHQYYCPYCREDFIIQFYATTDDDGNIEVEIDNIIENSNSDESTSGSDSDSDSEDSHRRLIGAFENAGLTDDDSESDHSSENEDESESD
eukprot:TRINITY_DN14605_c0_g1_i1.p1 TRINITY_DN14605_c0_g1~~TRINITY_DN14605_c0_g1_i1.p1  ORF type:complete len:125 (+),score=30.00 TRINITY_DN14605_c0_g1_i1:27-401(+)